jgi:hypothetical protein
LDGFSEEVEQGEPRETSRCDFAFSEKDLPKEQERYRSGYYPKEKKGTQDWKPICTQDCEKNILERQCIQNVVDNPHFWSSFNVLFETKRQ